LTDKIFKRDYRVLPDADAVKLRIPLIPRLYPILSAKGTPTYALCHTVNTVYNEHIR